MARRRGPETVTRPVHRRTKGDAITKNIVIAVDTKEHTLDALALGRLLSEVTSAPAVLLSIFGYFPLEDPNGSEMKRLREEARGALLELGASVGLPAAEGRVAAGNFAARALQRVTEEDRTALVVLGSTTRGPVGRLFIGPVVERLLGGAACPVAIAPRGYGDEEAPQLGLIGVGYDGSDDAGHAVDTAVTLAAASGARVRVITAFHDAAFGAAGFASASANDVLRRQLHEQHERAVAEIPASVEVESRFLEGAAVDVLQAEARDLDLLIVGSRSYGPIGAVLLGSVSAALTRVATCPLLVTPRGTRFDLDDPESAVSGGNTASPETDSGAFEQAAV